MHRLIGARGVEGGPGNLLNPLLTLCTSNWRIGVRQNNFKVFVIVRASSMLELLKSEAGRQQKGLRQQAQQMVQVRALGAHFCRTDAE